MVDFHQSWHKLTKSLLMEGVSNLFKLWKVISPSHTWTSSTEPGCWYTDSSAESCLLLKTVSQVSEQCFPFISCRILSSGVEDSASLTSHLTSTDSGIWSEASRSSAETSLHQKGATHVRENSYGGSSGYGSLSSFPGGARPKQPPQVKS